MPTSALILTVAILFGVFASDLGRRAVTPTPPAPPADHRRRRRRDVPDGFATSGAGLAIELAGAGTGACSACSPLASCGSSQIRATARS
jgi:hypothetical protein